MKKGTPLQELLRDESLDLSLSNEQFFFIQSFLLSEIKTQKPPKDPLSLCFTIVSENKKLKKFGDVSSSFIENLVSKTRQAVANTSVAFVQQQTLKSDKLSPELVVNYNNWLPCLPMFLTYQTILRTAQKEKVPIVFFAKLLGKDNEERCLFFKPFNKYEEVVPYENDLSQPAIFVEGVTKLASKSQWKERMCQRTIEVILAGAASHRQYPDAKEDERMEKLKDPDFERYRQIATNEGYSLENPETFFIQHVYPSTAQTLPGLVNRMRFIKERLATLYPKLRLADWPQRAVTQILFYLEN
ncbi:MAG: hypothetical protein HYX67_02100 [Candidatus Melainabacteria bacterium]|nr:hypothetical protein [Candidatus Melainabacteria bacterium]